MAQIDSYRSSLISRQNELSRFTADKAKEQLKIADLNKKINSASDAIRRTKNTSTINSKLKEIERYNKDIATTTKKIADLESKIVKKNKEIFEYQKKIDKEQIAIDKKRKAESEKLQKDQERSLRTINDTLSQHDRLHYNTIHEIQELKRVPEKITVLFLASNPIDQAQLRLDEEARSIAEMIRKAKHRDSVKFESCWALQTMDLLQALNEHDPAIVHFSGHGSDDDEIVFQTQEGKTKLVRKEAIVQTMMASADNIRLVFFNTCYSRNQAEAISEFVDATIGMNTSIGDDAARIFSSQFYSAIGFGFSVGKAFQQAKALLMMEGIPEENTPELFIKDGLKAEEIILVQP
ncbi:TPA: CHAT domain-containing protein [Elizabethkingia anophelis]|uniref:CHAT domain-containing protein n=1 Tax=Elizabethkingia anophelis TaxID=1117645 RepID=UPI001A262319|nr:CHAT domain-containing protein [Elizabethkingia anophelis]HAT3999161.1 CHAT domain-containing protein [Elizabethkingia anophelis]HAT4010169.1 CHAT domain-containing protein [Elizabethkingia anophelis]HAY3502274.1 CHAT domain-containing protein [Elizabethkingia anophelis]HAY3509690.1 CHAT domain-containing protein [Elizabethkingia anophelis]